MSDITIQVENLSKRYLISHKNGTRGGLRDGLRHGIENAVRAPFRWLQTVAANGANHKRRFPLSALRPPTSEEFWALRDVNLEVKQGEVVGIIGRNGAGKSTLLKILSRITEPTAGRIALKGRVASLLEVGTGFHPELTGRENIYLNGAILGMSRNEIKRKFDEIVAFSGVEIFLDTPVKRYSSGMYVRLAFAVAAHLEPEILIVDEVLAVGDADFQKKCLNKMDDVGHSGRTVLFVSHNVQAITRLCGRSIWLENGRVKSDGPAHTVVNQYNNSGANSSSTERTWNSLKEAPGDDVVRLMAVRVCSEDGTLSGRFDIRDPVNIQLEYEILQPGHVFMPHFSLANEAGIELFVSNDLDSEWRGRKRPVGRYVSTCSIPGNILAEGLFSAESVIATLNPFNARVLVHDSVMFRTIDPLSERDTARGDYQQSMPGVMRPIFPWRTRYEPATEWGGEPSRGLVAKPTDGPND